LKAYPETLNLAPYVVCCSDIRCPYDPSFNVVLTNTLGRVARPRMLDGSEPSLRTNNNSHNGLEVLILS